MIASLQNFFQQLTTASADEGGDESELQLATAALLVEMMRADDTLDASEQTAMREALGQEFGLDTRALDELIALAEAEARDAPGYYAFTSRINQHFSAAQKVRLMEYLWRVALADGKLAAHEGHLVRKLADLIHVGRGDNSMAKQHAKEFLAARRANRPGGH